MKMLQQAQQMTGKLQEVQEKLAALTVTGTAGGGMVKVEADGKGTVKRISIDPSVVNPADVEMLEDLLAVAVQEAQRKGRELAESEMKAAAGGLGLGGLPFKLPF
ncbi:MAG: YbaB/EbfC family nucleoid-associated protein [Gemmatimonadaceae bacterium]|nr:YbaB/EbfC family nucleoid-associated protein [Gemmatimonadaceae bacterium]MCW5826242.1 YbaB/EbfC family nucleoid-associated protein [Gemmatimonadaceae bacterium]